MDVHIIREVEGAKEECSLELGEIIEEAHEILRSRVKARGATCLLNYNIDSLQIELYNNTDLFVQISISGNAVNISD